MHPAPLNLITDIEGLFVGNAEDERAESGTTVLTGHNPFTASAAVLGGAPGTRDTALLEPEQTVEAIDAIVLSGGSAFGLDAAGGVQAGLVRAGRGFPASGFRVPIVCGAILFDLANGGNKNWGDVPPYRDLGRAAYDTAGDLFELGAAGAGFGATVADGAGGLGSASVRLTSGETVGALMAVNAVGSPVVGSSRRFWAAPFEIGDEFGGLGVSTETGAALSAPAIKIGSAPGENTTIGIVATDVALTKAQCKRLAIQAHDGIAQAIWPAHTVLDGDILFAVSTGARPMRDPVQDMMALGWAATAVVARAIARGIYEART